MECVRTLYPFQKEAVKAGSDRIFMGLWDDPGLGKTTEALVLCEVWGGGPRLIVCPNSLKGHWKRQIEDIYPGYKDQILVAGTAGRFYGNKNVDEVELPLWVITHYAGLRISREHYGKVDWGTVVLDEAHYIKNRKAKRTEAVLEITPQLAYRLCMTATPWSKSPADLWTQLYWLFPLNPGLPNFYKWRFTFCLTEDRWNPYTRSKYTAILGAKNLDALAKVMNAYGMLRTKKEVAPQLPPIIDTYMPLEPTKRQWEVYHALEDRSRVEYLVGQTGEAEGQAPTPVKAVNVLARMVKMSRWLSHPWYLDKGEKGSKLKWLEEWAEGFPYPALIVTRFKESAKHIGEVLKCAVATGDTPNRSVIVDKWRDGEGQFLVGTIHALGTGLNLDRAHTMVCYDQVTSPILMGQVRERCHRITTEHPVEVIYLVNEGTVDEITYQAFKNKWQDLEIVRRFLRQLRKEGEIRHEETLVV